MVPRRSDRPRCRRRHPHGRGQDPDPGLRREGAPHRDILGGGGEVGRGDLLRRQGAHDRRGRTNVRPDLRPLVGAGRAGVGHRREGDRDVRPCADGTVEGQGGLRDNLRRPLRRHRHRPQDRGDPLHRDPGVRGHGGPRVRPLAEGGRDPGPCRRHHPRGREADADGLVPRAHEVPRHVRRRRNDRLDRRLQGGRLDRHRNRRPRVRRQGLRRVDGTRREALRARGRADSGVGHHPHSPVEGPGRVHGEVHGRRRPAVPIHRHRGRRGHHRVRRSRQGGDDLPGMGRRIRRHLRPRGQLRATVGHGTDRPVEGRGGVHRHLCERGDSGRRGQGTGGLRVRNHAARSG